MDTSIILPIFGNAIAFSVIITNGFAAVVMFRYRKEFFKFISITYLFQQSICDVCFGVTYMLSPVNFKLLGYDIPTLDADNFVHIYIICRGWIIGHVSFFFWVTSVENMALLTLERYLKITRPLWYKQHVTDKMVVYSLAVPWIISLTYLILFGIYLGIINEDGVCYYGYENETMYMIIMAAEFITDFCLPIFLVIFCYIKIVRTIRNRIEPSQPGNAKGGVSKVAVKGKEAEKNAVWMMLSVSVVFFVSFGIMWIVAILLSVVNGDDSNYDTNFIIAMTGMMINSAINPFIYIAKYKDFRKYSKLMIGCK